MISHKQSELEKISNICKNEKYRCLSNSNIDEKLVSSIINNAIPFESPDILSITNNTIYAFEHFEFDSYKHNKKGSSYEKESQLERDKFFKEYDGNGAQTRTHVIESIGNAILYEENFINIFNNHLNKCSKYIQHIKKERKEDYPISVWFIAEDTNPLGTMYQDNEGVKPLVPYMLKKARLCIEKASPLSGIIFIFNYFDNTYFYIVKREDLIKLDDKVLNSQDIKLECTNPYSVISMVPIRKN